MIRKRVFPKMKITKALELKLFEKVALKMAFFLWEVGKFQAIAKGVGDRISFCVY